MAVTGSLDGWGAVLLLLGPGVLRAIVRRALIHAVTRRTEGGAASAEMSAALEGLRERVRQLEAMRPRMAELEERLDFTERIVARTREPDRLHHWEAEA